MIPVVVLSLLLLLAAAVFVSVNAVSPFFGRGTTGHPSQEQEEKKFKEGAQRRQAHRSMAIMQRTGESLCNSQKNTCSK